MDFIQVKISHVKKIEISFNWDEIHWKMKSFNSRPIFFLGKTKNFASKKVKFHSNFHPSAYVDTHSSSSSIRTYRHISLSLELVWFGSIYVYIY